MSLKNIVVVNSAGMARTFREMGHCVLELDLAPGPVDIVREIERSSFDPDILFECERLGPRTLLLGLGRCTFPKLFWSLDTHLNAWWHRYYGQAFDCVFSTQDHWVSRLRRMDLSRVEWLPWFGSERPFVPWAEREHNLAFVGRVTEHRPVRKRMAEHLADRFGMELFDGVPFDAMMDIYAASCIVPNESIFNEINFRLFEAASCGCVVLNPAIGANVSALFEPDKEIVVYSDIVDLDHQLTSLLRDPEKVHAMGRRAWERVNSEHLAGHRAQTILQMAETYGGKAPADEADMWVWLSVYRLNEAGMYESSLGPVVNKLGAWSHVSGVFAAIVRALLQAGFGEQARELLGQEARGDMHADSFEVNFTSAMAALALDDFELSRLFWVRHVRSVGRQSLGVPEGRFDTYLKWAGECERYWTSLRSGFFFDAGRSVPDSALECLMMAASLRPDDLGIVRRMESILARTGGGEDFRMSALSLLSLHSPDDWRLGVELGLANLRSMRLREGVEELVVACRAADAKGHGPRFDSVLASRSGQSLLARVRGYS